MAEGARLLSEYGRNSPSRVRISLSPPISSSLKAGVNYSGFFYNGYVANLDSCPDLPNNKK